MLLISRLMPRILYNIKIPLMFLAPIVLAFSMLIWLLYYADPSPELPDREGSLSRAGFFVSVLVVGMAAISSFGGTFLEPRDRRLPSEPTGTSEARAIILEWAASSTLLLSILFLLLMPWFFMVGSSWGFVILLTNTVGGAILLAILLRRKFSELNRTRKITIAVVVQLAMGAIMLGIFILRLPNYS